jgi:general secretion pathway protein M
MRSPRERQVLAVGGALAIVLVVLAFAWLPLERSRARLARELPGLRASVATMRAQAQEVRQLRTLPVRDAAASAPLSTLIASGTLAQGLPGARVSTLDAKRLKLAVDDASWTRLVEWLASVQSAHGLAVDSATAEALAAPGRVRAEIVLAAP